MLLSLLETILVTYLMEKDSASQEKLRLMEREDKQEYVKTDNSNTGETQITDANQMLHEWESMSIILKALKPNFLNQLFPCTSQSLTV